MTFLYIAWYRFSLYFLTGMIASGIIVNGVGFVDIFLFEMGLVTFLYTE